MKSKWKNSVPLWIQKYNNGLSCADIAKESGTNHYTVLYWLKKEGIKIKKLYYSGPKNRCWNGYEDISGRYWSAIRTNARRRGISLDITIEQAWELFLKQDKKCALTGLNLLISKEHNLKLITASLDRIDSTKGYTINNIQWVHKAVQAMKHVYSQDQYIQICYDVVKIHPEPKVRPSLDKPIRKK